MRMGRIDGPDACRMVRAARSQMARVGGEKYTCNVGVVCHEPTDGDQGRGVLRLNHTPNVDVPLRATMSTSRASARPPEEDPHRIVPST